MKEVIRHVRKANRSSTGGLSGTNYKTLQAWFHDEDGLAESLTAIFNFVATGKPPREVVQLFTAGRGVAISKDDGGIRPIVVGNIILRLVGSMALAKEAGNIADFFTKHLAPKSFFALRKIIMNIPT